MNETLQPSAWFAVLDSRNGRLCEGARLPTGRVHIEQRDALAEGWEEKQHHRPYMLAGKGRSYASTHHEDEERGRRFAAQAARWLAEQYRGRGLSSLTIFCSASLIGPLRKALDEHGPPQAHVVQEDLAWFSLSELAGHPAVIRTLG